MARCTATGNTCGTDTVKNGDNCPDSANGFRCRHTGPDRVLIVTGPNSHPAEREAPAGEAMREAGARALCSEWGYLWDGDPYDDDQVVADNDGDLLDRPSKALFRRGAEAALTIIRAEHAAEIARLRAGLEDAEARFADIAAGRAFRPRLHAAPPSPNRRRPMSDLKDLSGWATQGEWPAPEYDNSDVGSGDWYDIGGIAKCVWREEDARFIVALVNAFRAGQLHDDTALATDYARGRRDMAEEAAKICDARAAEWAMAARGAAVRLAAAFRALVANTPEPAP